MNAWLSPFLNVVLPVFLIAGAGYLYSMKFRVDLRGLTDLIIYLLAPCLVLHGLMTMEDLSFSMIKIPLAVGLVNVILLAVTIPILQTLSKRRGKSLRGLYLPILFQNSGNMGIPMCTLAFDEAGLRMGLLFFCAISCFHYSVGIGIAKGGRGGVLEFLRLPLIYVLILGILYHALPWKAPQPVLIPLEMLGKSSLPLMLFALGCQLRNARLSVLKLALGVTVLRLGGGFLAALAISNLLGLEGVLRDVFILLSVMPSAVMNFAIAEKYSANPSEVSSAILVSTIASVAVIPIVLAMLQGDFAP